MYAPGKMYEIRDETYYTHVHARAHTFVRCITFVLTIVQRKKKPICRDDYVALALKPPDVLRESRS